MRYRAPELAAVPGAARRGVAALGVLLALGLVVHAVHAVTGFGDATVDEAITTWLYDGILFGAALACMLRAVLVARYRVAWGLLAAGLGLWAAGDLYWTLAVEGTPSEDEITLGDAGWLSFYPACYLALALLVHARVPRLPRSVWLDGLIGALACGALGAALILPTLTAAAAGAETGVLIVNMAYPIGDLMLLGMVVGIFAVSSWRPDRLWLLLGGGLAASAIADAVYLDRLARDTYFSGGLVDTLWLAAVLLIALASWQPAPRVREARRGMRTLLLPVIFGISAIGLQFYDHFVRINTAALVLATTALIVVMVRLFLAFRDNHTMLSTSRREALTDALTGLGNRRCLLIDVEHALEMQEPTLLVSYDLDGFKAYNDGFGHPAGDALLARLGQKLAEAIGDAGTAYRMGGDEFCVLVSDRDGSAEGAAERCHAALTEHGRGFDVGASHGAVRLPTEAATTAQALQIADHRLYQQKAVRPSSPRTQARDVLMRVLAEREPELHDHLRSVARLATAVARRLGMHPDAVDEVARGAELHDVGKMAVPDAILDKPGALDDREWSFIQRHTLIGEAILSAAPALVPVARLVRSSHERFDGAGYPDGLAGDAIPLGSRIIFACDAYDAMVSDRPYAKAMGPDTALEQIREGRGNQFDPAVVAALCDAVREGDAERSDVPRLTADDLEAWTPRVPAPEADLTLE
jgi:two-component system, cell cycle response regulator